MRLKHFLLLILPLSLLCSCSNNAGETVNGTTLKEFTKDESGKYGLSVDNNVESFDFKKYVSTKHEWTVSTDSYGKDTYLTKSVPLEIGDNEYFVIVSDNDYTTFDCIIRRLPIYTVTFNTDGGNYIEPQKVQEGSLIQAVNNPTRNGYEFKGWSYDFSQPVMSDLIVTARWEANGFYNISYDSNGGQGSAESLSIPLGTNGYRYDLGVNFTKSGYYIDSWNSKADGTGTQFRLGSEVLANQVIDLKLYAIWKQTTPWSGEKSTDYYGLPSDGVRTAIRTAEEFASIYGSGNYILLADIDLNNKEWTPIGQSGSSSAFTGTFDGNGHQIKNMKITKNSYDRFGLFYSNHGEIKNVNLVDFNINLTSVSNYGSEVYIGGITGENGGGGMTSGKVINCSASGNISVGTASCSICAGGLVGRSQTYLYAEKSVVEASHASGNINITSTKNVSVGGLIGNNTVIPVKSCYANTSIVVNSPDSTIRAGGVIGNFMGSELCEMIVSDSVGLGSINITGKSCSVGGFMGAFDYLPADIRPNNYSLNTQSIISNGNNYTSTGGTCRIETRTTIDVIRANVDYTINF